ncbi:PRI1 primase, partial [Machaerirhynchus nigripectus]|nr:PRI1 primase [Machaerirhynchus nigripectus]
EDLGVQHRLWVYSGRRGVHCWVCDDAVRKWSPALRAAAVEYLSLVKVGARGARNPLPTPDPGEDGFMGVWAPPDPVEGRPVAPGLDQEWCGQQDQGRDSSPELDTAQHREPLQAEFPRKKDSVQRWELLRARVERARASGRGAAQGPSYAEWEVMLQFCFPRLDINVSKGLGHLLKSPFSVHPKTGGCGV